MSSLKDIEKRYFEKLFGMSSGYVLDFTNATFGEFFRRYNVNIHGPKYRTFGTSKAKKLRAFWESESDQLVGTVLSEMLGSYQANCELNGQSVNMVLLERARRIVDRLNGGPVAHDSAGRESEFLDREFSIPRIHKLPIDTQVVPIVEARLNEARVALRAGTHLSVIFLCGSVLEAVLLGSAQQSPAKFNQATATPTKDGSPKRFHEWTLAQLINVACEIGILKLDIKKFSHGLRDFRNYIHPYEQLVSGFTPDEHTAKVCFQVLKAALADLAGERQ
ncbi:MAG: hypothetical protein F4Y81_04975 [Rhodothermaceae bacterium]|nr:hypothetical protein [Rhodothermaceae bacterium]MYG70333.1 hypothetical protein [Rhodothermaceae bacterium]